LNGKEYARSLGGQITGEIAQERLLAAPSIVVDQTMPAGAGGARNFFARAV
jgi:hypothetical protein